MIFPHVPRRTQYATTVTTQTQAHTLTTCTTHTDNTQAPLRKNTHMHTLTGPAAQSVGAAVEQRDKVWEFTMVCVCLLTWVTYWLGAHRSWW